MRKTITPLMIFGFIWSVIVLLSWVLFPDWARIPGGFLTLAGLTAVGVIAFLKDGYSFIKDFLESRRIVEADSEQIVNHDLYPDDDSQVTNIRSLGEGLRAALRSAATKPDPDAFAAGGLIERIVSGVEPSSLPAAGLTTS